MELKAEMIKKALECCQKDDCDHCPNTFGNCYSNLAGYALALINELENDNEVFASELSRYQELCKKIADENEYLKSTDIGDLNQEYDSLAKSLEDAIELIDKLRAKKAMLTEENERLRVENETLKIATNDQYSHLCDCHDKIAEMLRQKEADTVREMHSEIKERCIKGGIYPAFVASTIDQIAKEMLEGQDGTR